MFTYSDSNPYPNVSDSTSPAAEAALVSDRVAKQPVLALDPEIEALVSESERSPVSIAQAAGVLGQTEIAVVRLALPTIPGDVALAMGWMLAQFQMQTALAGQPTSASASSFRRGLYESGARKPSRRESADERNRRQQAQSCAAWGYGSRQVVAS